MKSVILYSLLLLAAQTERPVKPSKELDSKDPASVLEHAAYNTRTQKSYETTFKATLTTSGAPLNYDGRCVWVHPGVLYVHYTVTGGEEKMIIRVGPGPEEAWIYHSLAGLWATAAQLETPGAGRGIQNPDEVLAVISRNTGSAKLIKPGVVELSFSGGDIEKVMKEQASKGSFVWNQSSATIVLTVDAENRLQNFTCDATLQPTDPQIKGKVRYTAEVTLVAYNGARELKFLDENKREIPLTPEMKAKIGLVLKEKK